MKTKHFMLGCWIFCVANAMAQGLSGVWVVGGVIAGFDKEKIELSWSVVDFSGNDSHCIAIDTLGKNPTLYIGGQGRYPIKSEQRIDENTFILSFFFTRGNFMINCRINMLSVDRFWIESIEGISLFATGKKYEYIRVSKPDLK